MEQWLQIRQRVLREGVSKRQILKETGMHWTTLEKILNHSSPPGYQRTKPPKKTKIGPYLNRIKEILEQDKTMPKKQRHTAHRIWQRLQAEGFTGGYTIVKDAVREIKKTNKEVFMPLKHPPGEAQIDFGQAVVKMDGILRKIFFFVMALPYSDVFFVKAYERECTETFWDGRITYDNSRIAMSKIIGPRERDLTEGFLQLASHYLFRHHFCLVRRPNEKGVVEGLVRFSRQNFLVPVPQVRDFEELNAHLLNMCREDMQRKVRGQAKVKEKLLSEEQFSFRPLPFKPFDACRSQGCGVNSELLVRFDDNDYSVPMEYAYHDVTVKGYTARVAIYRFNDLIAVHRRCWEKEKQIFNPLHYLPLLERKPHSLAFGRPFENFTLPKCFEILSGRMEAELENGVKEYIGVLRLLETYSLKQLTKAVEKSLRLRVHNKDGIKQFLPAYKPSEPATFKRAGREYLQAVEVWQANIGDYGELLCCGGPS
ncbi:MAG: IS21 family transposase [Deltaproteobacteria bacterium]|nr:IS21 family transposase [Deltaproteobacteria bacterium]